MKVDRQKIKATAAERQILIERHRAAQRAIALAKSAQLIANEQFTLFCDARGIPRGAELIDVDEEHVIVDVPRNGRGAAKRE